MSDLRQAAMLALDALENHTAIKHPQQIHYRDAAIDALRSALETDNSVVKQSLTTEPVAYCKILPLKSGSIFQKAEVIWLGDKLPIEGPLYTVTKGKA